MILRREEERDTNVKCPLSDLISFHLCNFRMLLYTAPAFLITSTLALIEGIVAFAYYFVIRCDPLASKEIRDPNQVCTLLLYIFTVFQDDIRMFVTPTSKNITFAN